MKRFIPLLALFAAGVVASYALASPPPGHHDSTASSSTSTSEHGKSGEHGTRCHPLNMKGTVANGTIQLLVKKVSGHSSQLQGTTATLMVNGPVSVQAWACRTAGSTANTAPTLFLRQLHSGGKPQSEH
jgi:hypothetical protein